MLEGLQIEEEGLTDYMRKKTKQPADIIISRTNNDPFDNVYTGTSHKNGQTLKGYSSSRSFINRKINTGQSTYLHNEEDNANGKSGELPDDGKFKQAAEDETEETNARINRNGGSGHKRKKRHPNRKHRRKQR